MVERVGRGRIRVSAAAALGAVSAGLLAASPAMAGGQDTTLQIRVEVVERCRIRVLPGGLLDQACGGGLQPAQISVGEMVADLGARAAERLDSPPALPSSPSPGPPTPGPPVTVVIDPMPRVGAAVERANQVAASIAERVRYITLAY
jgi:hypothetical protein